MTETAIILLAAGSGSRMGSIKQLLTYGGQPLICHAARTALECGRGPVIVVVGANAGEVGGALEGLPVEVVRNDEWQGGMGTSIQAGIRRTQELGLSGAILALADQPLVTAEMLRHLITEHERTGAPIVASQYSGTVGVPVYFAASHFGALLALGPDQGCKGVILKQGDTALLVECPEAAVDVDTQSDYESLLARI